jgi:hypothetical protein
MNWRGIPLTDYQTIVDLIRKTRTRTGLSVQCQLDTNKYDVGVQITDEQMLGVFVDELYWSSTADTQEDACAIDLFTGGNTESKGKHYEYLRVRPVRTF